MAAVIRRSRIFFPFLLLPALSACTSGGTGGGGTTKDPAAPAGAVVAIEGDVTARRATATSSRALALESSVFADDEVTTAAAAQVQIRLHHNDALWTLAASRSTRVDASAAWSAPRQSGGDLLLVRDDREDRTRAAARAGSQEGISSGEAALDEAEVAGAGTGPQSTRQTVASNAPVPPPPKPERRMLPEPPKPDPKPKPDTAQESVEAQKNLEGLFGGEGDTQDPDSVQGDPKSPGGIGGLGLRGTGKGGGGTSDGVIGLGNLGTKGKGSGSASGYGSGSGKLGGKADGVGTVVLDDIQMTPATESDAVKTIVKQNWSQIRYCVERGWVVRPSASGTLQVEFIIGPEGTVLTSVMKTANSSFDSGVSPCVSDRPKRWQFPKPQAITKVTLTIVATPAESSAVEPSPAASPTATPAP